MRRYYDVFKPSQIKIIIYEDFRDNNLKMYQEIIDFLGLDPGLLPQNQQMNVSKEIRYKQLNYLANNQMLKNLTKTLFGQGFNDMIREKVVEKLFGKKFPSLQCQLRRSRS